MRFFNQKPIIEAPSTKKGNTFTVAIYQNDIQVVPVEQLRVGMKVYYLYRYIDGKKSIYCEIKAIDEAYVILEAVEN